jgi:hypothetical protein
VVWEGDGAIEEESDDEAAIAFRRKLAMNAYKTTPDLKEESEDEASSEDDYIGKDGGKMANQEQVRYMDHFPSRLCSHPSSVRGVSAFFPHRIQTPLMNPRNGV